jgi:hypothetical protein
MILIKNMTGQSLAPGHIVGVDGLINVPETNAPGWDFHRFYKAVKPDLDKYPFAIVIETIAAGKAGYALANGVCKISLDVKDGNHQYAQPITGSVERMESCAAGPARIWYRQTDSGVGQALVQFPIGGQGGEAEPARRVYVRSMTGGVATVSDIIMMPTPAANPNHRIAMETYTRRYEIGTPTPP